MRNPTLRVSLYINLAYKYLFRTARQLVSLRVIGVILLLTLFTLVFLRITGEGLSEATLSLPPSCFAKDGTLTPDCDTRLRYFYAAHDYLLNGDAAQAVLSYRIPVLLAVGIFAPLVIFTTNLNDTIITKTLRPFFYLIIAHGISLTAGNLILGVGILPWIGAFYSLMRSVQLLYLAVFVRKISRFRPKDRLRLRLYVLALTILLCAWFANFLYLALFLGFVSNGIWQLKLNFIPSLS